MKIREILEKKKVALSFEFFPPKKIENEHILEDTIRVLKRFSPDFVSITYGAGGSTREKTLEWTLRMKRAHGLNVMMHLTCVASTENHIRETVEKLQEEGVENILALRGDPPVDFPAKDVWKDFRYAYQLVKFLRNMGDFSIGVAGYPEGHVESPSLEADVEFLKMKVDQGADFVITQLFFENRYYFDFVKRAEKAGVRVPIIPGIMPIVNLGQVKRFTQMCGATVPKRILQKMDGKSPEDTLKLGVEFAVEQCQELLRADVPGLHFYTLNRNRATEMILEQLRLQ